MADHPFTNFKWVWRSVLLEFIEMVLIFQSRHHPILCWYEKKKSFLKLFFYTTRFKSVNFCNSCRPQCNQSIITTSAHYFCWFKQTGLWSLSDYRLHAWLGRKKIGVIDIQLSWFPCANCSQSIGSPRYTDDTLPGDTLCSARPGTPRTMS